LEHSWGSYTLKWHNGKNYDTVLCWSVKLCLYLLLYRQVHILAPQAQQLEHHQLPILVLPQHLTLMDQSKLRGCQEQLQVSVGLWHVWG
jgi:hypothetical protein